MLAACSHKLVRKQPIHPSAQSVQPTFVVAPAPVRVPAIAPASAPALAPVWLHEHPEHFSRIDVKGLIHLQVIGADDQKDTLVYLNNQAVTFKVVGDTLFIEPNHKKHRVKSRHGVMKTKPHLETVKILANDLRAIHLTHGPTVDLESIKSRHGLTVIDESRGDLILKGRIRLKKLIKHYPGLVRIYWIDSNCVSIKATQGNIHLAGVVGQLHVKASGSSTHVDLKSLRAYHAFVEADDHSWVTVLALQSLHAFAKNCALIDYYKHPKQLNVNTQQQGKVMQIDTWR